MSPLLYLLSYGSVFTYYRSTVTTMLSSVNDVVNLRLYSCRSSLYPVEFRKERIFLSGFFTAIEISPTQPFFMLFTASSHKAVKVPQDEISRNPRARSARLRVAERLAAERAE